MAKLDRRSAFALAFASAAMLFAIGARPSVSAGSPHEADVRAHFERFLAAQKARDADGVRDTLLDSPDFVYVARGTPVWGRDAVMDRFRAAYQGTWQPEADLAQARVISLGDGAAQLFVPFVLTAAPAGQTAQPARYTMNQTLVRTGAGWRIASISPVPIPPQ